MSRICQRAEDVEHCADADLAAGRANVFHSRVKGRGEHEAEADLQYAVCYLLGAKIDACAQGFQYIGAATAAGGRTVALLCHLCATSGRHNASRPTDVECPPARPTLATC